MKISEFISRALFDENSGYYRKKKPIGKKGDFITSPEISQAFGEVLAAFLLSSTSNSSNNFSLVEAGAGNATLFFDVLNTISKLAESNNSLARSFLERANFHVIEINESLIDIQKDRLSQFHVKWHRSFREFISENNRELVFFSNEFFDCFPIDQFVSTDIGWCERLTDGAKFFHKSFDPEINKFVSSRVGSDKPFGAIYEYSAEAEIFMADLCSYIKEFGGMAVNIDYGYFYPDFSNSLQSVKNHKKVGIFDFIGESDITSHVNFGILDQIAKNYSLNSSFITQGEFLTSLGIEERRKMLPSESAAIDRLINNDQMGQLFKCHIIWK